jgi:hypothetical protein
MDTNHTKKETKSRVVSEPPRTRNVSLTRDLCFPKLISIISTAGVSDRPSLGTARSPTRVAVTAEALVPAVERANTEQDRSDLSPWRIGTYQCGINLLQ